MLNGPLEIDAVEDGQVVLVRVPAETIRDVADRLEDAAPGM
jgi:predicted dinucleotide-binding enzyme